MPPTVINIPQQQWYWQLSISTLAHQWIETKTPSTFCALGQLEASKKKQKSSTLSAVSQQTWTNCNKHITVTVILTVVCQYTSTSMNCDKDTTVSTQTHNEVWYIHRSDTDTDSCIKGVSKNPADQISSSLPKDKTKTSVHFIWTIPQAVSKQCVNSFSGHVMTNSDLCSSLIWGTVIIYNCMHLLSFR